MTSVRPSVCLSVRLSVTLCALWLSGLVDLVYRAKSCTSMFLAGKFLFVLYDYDNVHNDATEILSTEYIGRRSVAVSRMHDILRCYPVSVQNIRLEQTWE